MKFINTLLLAGAIPMMCPDAASAQPQIYNFITIAGVGYGSADGTNSDARFWHPWGVAVDGGGNVYVADTRNSTIRKLTPSGTNWVSSTITNSDAGSGPVGVAVDRGGAIYVAYLGGPCVPVMCYDGTIHKLTLVGTNWVSSTIAGLAGSYGSADGTNSDARFGVPYGVVVDNGGNVYVADGDNNTIRKLTLVGTNWVTSTIAGLAGSYGSADGTNSAARFWRPVGVAVDNGGNIYVADNVNSTIRKLTPLGTNWVSSTIAGLAGYSDSADGTNSDARFVRPAGIAVDNGGNVYVADESNATIRKLTQVGTNWVTSTIAGLAGSYGSADGTNSAARFWQPEGVAVDNGGNVYVADEGNSTIRKLTPMGTNWVSSTIAGDPTYGSADGTNSDARFVRPGDIAVDNGGNVYVPDNGNSTIRKLTPVGTNWVSSTIAGLAQSQGDVDGTNSDARFNGPSGVAVDSGGSVYVADGGNSTIRKLMPVGTNWVSSTIAGLAWDQGGGNGSADGTNSDARFDFPDGIAVDSGGNVYVADNGNSTIRKLTPVGTNWVSSTIAGLAGSYGSADGTNGAVRFWRPVGVAVDSGGNVYVADNGNSTIRKLTPVGTNWVSRTIAGLAGSHSYADGTNNDARFVLPEGIAVDNASNVYVADDGPIRKLTPVGTNWVSSTITNSGAGLYSAGGIAVDSAGNIYLTDGNNTIREGLPLAVAPLPPVFQTVTRTNGLITFTWSASTGRTYQLQYNPDLSATNWRNLGGTTTATNGTLSASDALGPDRQRFYRIAVLP